MEAGMADTLNKLLSSTTDTTPVSFKEGAAIALNYIEAAFDVDEFNEIVTLGEHYECIVSSKAGSVHILIDKIGAKKYVFDKVYTNRTWATKRFLAFIASISDLQRVLIDRVPALDLEKHHAHGPIAEWVQHEVLPAVGDVPRPARREDSFGAVVDTKIVGPGKFASRWREVKVTVGWEQPFENGMLGWIAPTEGAWIARLTFGGTTLERDAETEREAKELVCSMANLLEAWKY
jgi:hypothetical protein